MPVIPYPKQKTRKRVGAILASLRKGATLGAACAANGISQQCFWKWRCADPALYKMTRDIMQSRVEIVADALYTNATEHNNVAAQIFFLKNRSNGEWRDEQHIKADVRVEQIEKLSDEELDALIIRGRQHAVTPSEN